jgi:23S rRNA pseudouridine955/2504/2580 synthase
MQAAALQYPGGDQEILKNFRFAATLQTVKTRGCLDSSLRLGRNPLRYYNIAAPPLNWQIVIQARPCQQALIRMSDLRRRTNDDRSRAASKKKSGARYVDIDADRDSQRLDNFLLATLKGVPRSHIYRLVRSGQVRVNSGRVAPSYRLKAGDQVRVPPVASANARATPPAREGLGWLEARILFEDRRLIVVDKPAGMAVHGGGSARFGCIEALRSLRPGRALELVHRLDKSTSGCLMIAGRRSALRSLHELFRDGRIHKTYVALVKGAWPEALHRVEVPLDVEHRATQALVRVADRGKPAVSRFSVRERFSIREAGQPIDATLVEIVLDTGRTHQIRVHAAHAGHPVLGDDRYGDRAANSRLARMGLGRMFLHASSIAFDWPDGESFAVAAPLPRDLERTLERLRHTVRRP